VKEMSKLLTIPNLLTISRILLLPIFAVGFLVGSRNGLIVSLLVFALCCITDYLDGYYARAYKQTTKIGQILDPLADKIVVSIAILFMAWSNIISTLSMIPASIILCREIIISGVRDAEEFSGSEVQTSRLSKWKTATQMIAISVMLFSAVLKSGCILKIGEIIFWVSSAIAIVSGFVYCKKHVF
jgi:cardiolipin synthase